MSAEEICKWAKEMGYPGADSPQFQDLLKKLSIPQTRQLWSHLIRHVLPADEVRNKQRQLLVYKHFVENRTQNTLEKFNSLGDYEAFLKKSKLETKLSHLETQLAQMKVGIANSSQKLSQLGSQSMHEHQANQEKLEKLQLLRLKRAELDKQMNEFSQTTSLFDVALSNHFFHVEQITDSSSEQVAQFCQSLKRGQEAEIISQCISSAMSKRISFTGKFSSVQNTAMSIVDKTQELQRQCLHEVEELHIRKQRTLNQLEQKKQDIISKYKNSQNASDQVRVPIYQEFFDSDGFAEVISAASHKYLVEWLSESKVLTGRADRDNKSEADDEVYNQICELRSEVLKYISVSIEELRQVSRSIVSKIQAEAATTENTTIQSNVKLIVSLLPQLIKALTKTPIIPYKSHTWSQSLEKFNYLESIRGKMEKMETISTIEQSWEKDNKIVSHNKLIAVGESVVTQRKREMKELIDRIAKVVIAVEKDSKELENYLEFWRDAVLTEESATTPHYRQLLSLYKSFAHHLPVDSLSAIVSKAWSQHLL